MKSETFVSYICLLARRSPLTECICLVYTFRLDETRPAGRVQGL